MQPGIKMFPWQNLTQWSARLLMEPFHKLEKLWVCGKQRCPSTSPPAVVWMKMPQNSWGHCNSFAHFQKAFWAPCRVHWLSLLNVELCKTDDGSCPMSSLQHTVYKQHHWTAEATGLCLCKSCYSGILFVKSWMQEKHMSSTSTRGHQTADLKKNLLIDTLQLMLDQCQQKKQQAALCSACAEWRQMYWRNCNLSREKNWSTPLSYFDS